MIVDETERSKKTRLVMNVDGRFWLVCAVERDLTVGASA